MTFLGGFWIGLAVLNAYIARTKNRSGLNWFVVSLLSGPLATILVRSWPPPQSSGTAEWAPGQLASGFAVALLGSLACAWFALAIDGGPLGWLPSVLYLVG